MKAAGIPSIGSDEESRGALAAVPEAPFAPMPADKREEHILSQAVCCMHGWEVC